MKWKDVIVLLLDSADRVIKQDADAWKARYKVPDERCFANEAVDGYQNLDGNCLADLSSLETKVIVTCHGNERAVGRYRAEKFAEKLAEWGLGSAGLIAIKSCEAGKGHLLEDIAGSLGTYALQVGWLNGYRASAAHVPLISATEGIGFPDFLLRTLTIGYAKLPDSWRIRVVKGNVNVTPPNGVSSRYPSSEVTEEV